jgi:hypothetical protein
MKLRLSECLLVVAVVVVGLSLSGCQSMKAEPSKGAGFVPVDQMSQRADLPFNKAWVQAGVDWKKYRPLYIKDVNTQYLLEANWWQENFSKEDMDRL